MTIHHAACSCGALTVACEGEPLRVSVCHCHACQRRTGSAFGLQARYPSERVQIAGEATSYERTGDSGTGNVITFRFCPRCGSTVTFTMTAMPGMIAVAGGAFADARFHAPTVSMYEDRRHDWVGLPANIERIA